MRFASPLSFYSSLASRKPRACGSVSRRIPDILDPTPARTFVGRLVFRRAVRQAVRPGTEKLNVVPMLATPMSGRPTAKALTLKLRQGVTFHDGEKLDAAAVKFNSSATRTCPARAAAPSSRRWRASTWWMRKRAPQPLRAVGAAAHRAHRPRRNDGLAEGGAGGARQVRRASGVLGPFRFVERIAQDRIVLERHPGYWTRAASISSASSTCRSSTRPCASPTCAPASSISSSAWRPPTFPP